MEVQERRGMLGIFGAVWCAAVVLLFDLIGELATCAYLAQMPWTPASCIVHARGLTSGVCTTRECAPPWEIPGGLRKCPGHAKIDMGFELLAVLPEGVMGHGANIAQHRGSFPDLILQNRNASTTALSSAGGMPKHALNTSDACNVAGFIGGTCQRMSDTGDQAELLQLECTYRAWAEVSVASAPGDTSRPGGTFCAFSLGIDNSIGFILEDPTWDTACSLYGKLEGQNRTIPCLWRNTLLTRRPRVALTQGLAHWFANQSLVCLRFTALCFMFCCVCLFCTVPSHGDDVTDIYSFVLAASLLFSTAIDLCRTLPISSTVAVVMFFLLLRVWALDRALCTPLSVGVAALVYLAYVLVGSLCFMDDLIPLYSFILRGATSLVLLEFMRVMKQRSSLRRGRHGTNGVRLLDGSTPADWAQPFCSTCGRELCAFPWVDRPLLCGRCALLRVLRVFNMPAALLPGLSPVPRWQRYSLRRVASDFFQVEASPAAQECEVAEEDASEQLMGCCRVCMEDTRIACVFVPCGHGGLCQVCARRIFARSGPQRCHMCREHVECVIEISAMSGQSATAAPLLGFEP